MYGVSKIEHSRRHESLAGTFADTVKCLSPASFWMPRWIVSTEWLQHAPFAFWLIDKARPKTIVELGTDRGVSYLTLCQAVQDLGLSTTCRAIDVRMGDEHSDSESEEIFSQLKDYHDTHYAGFSQLTKSTFAETLDSFAEQSIDLLHIDGCRFHEDVLENLESWLPKLSKTALLLLHNSNEDKTEFGVAKLWRELRARYPSFEFKHGSGLGLLAVGSEMPLSLRPLFLATEATRDAIGQIYERLGLSVKDQIDLSALRQKEAQESVELERLESELQARSESFQDLRTEIDALRSAIVAYPVDEIAALQAELDQRSGELAAYTDRIAILERELAAKAGEVAALKSQAEANQEQRRVLEALNAQLIEENDEFYRDVENYALAQQNLDRQVSTLDQEIAAYRAANEALRQQAREELASALERSTFLEERLSAMELSVEETSQQLARSLDRSAFLEERLIGSDASLEEAKQDLAGSLDRSNSLEQQLETASQDLAKSLERVSAMESSTSWKLTKPLRILSDAVRRFTRRAR
jgi:hypothetical protein